MGFPTGWLQLQLLQHLPEEQLHRRGLIRAVEKDDDDRVPESSPHRDDTGSVIDYLENSLGRSVKQTPR